MPSPNAMQVLTNILRQSLRKRDKQRDDPNAPRRPTSRPKPRQPTRALPPPPNRDANANEVSTDTRSDMLRQSQLTITPASYARASRSSVPSQTTREINSQDFTLSLDYAHDPAEVHIENVLQQSWLNFCLQKNDGVLTEDAVLVAAGESAKISRRLQTDAKIDRSRASSMTMDAQVKAVRPTLRHTMSSANVPHVSMPMPSCSTSSSTSDTMDQDETGSLYASSVASSSKLPVVAPLKLKPKRSMPQLEGVWEEFLVETAEDIRTLSPTPLPFDSCPSSSKSRSMDRRPSTRSLKQTRPPSPVPRKPRHSPSAPSLSALASTTANFGAAPPVSPSQDVIDDLINFYSAEHASTESAPSSSLRRKSEVRRGRAPPIASLRLSTSTLQALVPDVDRPLDDDPVDPILPTLDEFPSPPNHHRRNPSLASEWSRMSSSRSSSVSSIATEITPTTANFPATPPLSRSSSRSTPASILKKHGKYSSPSSSPTPVGKQLSNPNLAHLTPEESMGVHFDNHRSRGLVSPTFFNVPVINGDHAELQIVPEPPPFNHPMMRRHMAMPSDASSYEDGDASGEMVFYPQTPRFTRKQMRVDASRPLYPPLHMPAPKRPTESKSIDDLRPTLSMTMTSSNSPSPRPKSTAPGLWRRKNHSESSALPQMPPGPFVVSSTSSNSLARPRPLTVLSEDGKLRANNAVSKPYFQSFGTSSVSSDSRITKQSFVKPETPAGIVQYGYAF